MSKHKHGNKAETLWGMLKYPVSVYKHWFLNNWNYFTKPKLFRKIKQWINQ
jgi:hypothetical protein